MISLQNVAMGFRERTLFKDVSLSIFQNEKIGLTGPNGAGKTTLFSIILGEMEPLEGQVQIQKNINVGYLPQEVQFVSDRTVVEELTEGDARIKNLMQEKRHLEDTHQAGEARYGDILHELEQLGIYELENRAEKILMGLGFKPTDFHRPIRELSGGWQMRTLLAKLLTYPYDLLLLDEPTNYLDLGATLWLKNYLAAYKGAFVLISHDRVFLNEVTNYTIMLERSQMTKIKGNYETFIEQMATQRQTMEKRQKVVEKKRQQLERFTQRFHAQPNRAAAVRNKRKMIERLENIELPQTQESVKAFAFAGIPSSGYTVVTLKDIHKSYGEKKVYQGVDLEICRGQKVCLVGPNGAGKSTLLKMLAGTITPDQGTLTLGHQVECGYFSQTRLDVLQPERSAFDEVAGVGGSTSLRVRSLLGLFNFRGDDVFKKVKVLSGGEKSRLILAKLLINPPNFMLLDEPTTHLDLDGVKALTEAFKEYTGTVCFISHDLFFIQEIADHIIEVDEGSIKNYAGGLDYYLEKKGQKHLTSFTGKKDSNNKGNTNVVLKKNNKGGSNEAKSSKISSIHDTHKKALKRVTQIKTQLQKLTKEYKELETESYVKARVLSKAFDNRDKTLAKEYGVRLKEIQSRLREIETEMTELKSEKRQIGK